MAVESTFRRRILALAFQNSFHGVQKFFRLWVVRELNFPWNCAVWSRNDTMEVKTPNFERDAPHTFNSNFVFAHNRSNFGNFSQFTVFVWVMRNVNFSRNYLNCTVWRRNNIKRKWKKNGQYDARCARIYISFVFVHDRSNFGNFSQFTVFVWVMRNVNFSRNYLNCTVWRRNNIKRKWKKKRTIWCEMRAHLHQFRLRTQQLEFWQFWPIYCVCMGAQYESCMALA